MKERIEIERAFLKSVVGGGGGGSIRRQLSRGCNKAVLSKN
jgi:hypothetical protein